MYPGGPNPTRLQSLPPGKLTRPPPLVLVHDGGGTTFSYFMLGVLGRDVWAIHNPKFFEGLHWEGGLDEMAETYLGYLVRDEGLAGPVVLGGWSLGGFLSIAMAHLIARKPDAYPISVAGLLLIDSPYHVARRKITQPTSKAELTDIPALVTKSFDNCDIMLQDWDLPRWQPDSHDAKTMSLTIGGQPKTLHASEALRKTAQEAKTWTTMQFKTYVTDVQATEVNQPAAALGSPPPAVLVRCTKYAKPRTVPGQASGGQPPVCLVDLYRDEKLLGWEARYPDFIKAVIDIDADHYSIFDKRDFSRAEAVTEQLVQGLEVLDAIHKLS